VTEAHVRAALESAQPGPLAEGNVGGGTGMICYEFKGGTGTASREVELEGTGYTIRALVQANQGIRPWPTVLGVPVGQHLTEDVLWSSEQGSIIVVLATDLPLLPIQLKRLARRIAIGVGRTGTPSGDNSGDIFLVFSTANDGAFGSETGLRAHHYLANEILDPAFLATVEAVEEAIVNAMLGAETMTGRDDHEVVAIDHDRLCEVMRRYGRLDG
jgi:L-aminopeptidase/D-esterase-like protein